MKNKKHEIVPQSMSEIESLNEIVELDIVSLEMIAGGIALQARPCSDVNFNWCNENNRRS